MIDLKKVVIHYSTSTTLILKPGAPNHKPSQHQEYSIALATKGVLKLLVAATSLLLTTTTPMATKPLMVERSTDGSPAEEDATIQRRRRGCKWILHRAAFRREVLAMRGSSGKPYTMFFML
jgi:hypothetical protein